MANKILASSLDNFIQMSTSSSVNLPYVTFTLGQIPNSGVTITITDANDENGYRKEINGGAGYDTTLNSFNTSGDMIYTFMECLKMNSIFYNVTIQSSTMLKAFLDTSLKYNIVSTSGIIVGGNYSSYSPSLPNKSVLLIRESGGTEGDITMEKYHNSQTVTFNITSPYQKTMFHKPIDCTLNAYTLTNGTAHSANTSPYSTITVMPTTLTKFQSVDYDDYLYTQAKGSCKFLTTQLNRYYNYGEWVGLSILTDVDFPTLVLRKSYYTNSGVFLKTEYSVQYVEKNGKRYDLYDVFNLNSIEAQFDKQVGYILVSVATSFGSSAISNEVRYEINPKCDGNNEIFFLNEIGGIDSFNFTNTKQVNRSIDKQNTYNINHISDYINEFEYEYVLNKRNKITTTLSTNQLDISIAKWLNQLVKSKYTFKFLGIANPMFKIIVVDKFDIQTNTADDEFELNLEYHDADNDSLI